MIPPPPEVLDPLVEVWSPGGTIVRCHSMRYGERQFNPTDALARFRPVRDNGVVVPTLYGAADFEGAVSETVFHDVPVRGADRRVLRDAVAQYAWSELAPTRELRLIALHGAGLGRVQVTRAELIESDAAHYAETAAWGDALYRHEAMADGLCWRSRQHDDSLALMLFGTRVAEDDLRVVRRAASLLHRPGGERLYAFAETAGIAILS